MYVIFLWSRWLVGWLTSRLVGVGCLFVCLLANTNKAGVEVVGGLLKTGQVHSSISIFQRIEALADSWILAATTCAFTTCACDDLKHDHPQSTNTLAAGPLGSSGTICDRQAKRRAPLKPLSLRLGNAKRVHVRSLVV